MVKIIHIGFSECAGISLRHAFKKKESIEENEVITFDDDISQGPIADVINVGDRINWWNNIYKEDKLIQSHGENYLQQEYSRIYKSVHKKILRIKNSDVIYLWYGNCGSEICGMLYTLELLKGKCSHIYIINVSDVIHKIENGDVYTYRSLGDVMTEQLKPFIKQKRKVKLEEYDELIKAWNLLKRDNSILRVFKDGKVKSVGENYFDSDILKYTEKEFKKSARTVGAILGNSETKICDDYIFWRVKELVRSGIIEFKGAFGVMREMDIRITEKGLDYMSTDLESMEFWRAREEESQIEVDLITDAKYQGRIEERINIAKKLIGVLAIEIIAEKTGLTKGQVENLTK
ncbi:DUF1835 domain-containing protein [Clostridium gasigenes]|uniref:DUF1835 domain-containing protein n=1 Tax=Clostridium gasigenes TaxID=94869 RepID=UPI0014385CE4|nr:DUF1835 domain-containing protein [Clostridium gasigenes]NKF06849.1 DUF1835 domain-containing protein [Clostridium gasigenes]QSW19882.1 DUF1835 domain-containing protein [Clostridium gasigenes]